MPEYKLGKLPPKAHPHTLNFGRYIADELLALPTPARKVYREYKTPAEARQMFANDRLGICACAMAANFLILTTVHTGEVVIPSEDEVVEMYSAVSGYDPQTGANDNGAYLTDVLEYLRTTGLAGHKILAWAKIASSHLEHRKLGVDLFGSTLVGVQLPNSALAQFNAGQSWELVSNDGGIAGGHAILHPGYGHLGDDYVTWAKWDQKASAAWSNNYVDEEYIVITEDWFNQATERTPGGLDLATLEADLGELRLSSTQPFGHPDANALGDNPLADSEWT